MSSYTDTQNITFRLLWARINDDYRRMCRDIVASYGAALYAHLDKLYSESPQFVRYVYIDNRVKYTEAQYDLMYQNKAIMFISINTSPDFNMIGACHYPFMRNFINTVLPNRMTGEDLTNDDDVDEALNTLIAEARRDSLASDAVNGGNILDYFSLTGDDIDEEDDVAIKDAVSNQEVVDDEDDSCVYEISDKIHGDVINDNYKRINTPLQFFFKALFVHVRQLSIICNLRLDFGKKNKLIAKVEDVMSLYVE